MTTMTSGCCEDGKFSSIEVDGISEIPSVSYEDDPVEEQLEAELNEGKDEAAVWEEIHLENKETEVEENHSDAVRETEEKFADESRKEGDEDVYGGNSRDGDLDENIAAEQQQESDWQEQRDEILQEKADRKEDVVMIYGDTDLRRVDADHFSRSSSYFDDPADGRRHSRGKLFIGGLTRDTTTDMLTNHFMKYGEIIDSVIMKNRSTGHPRGFGFVTFSDPSVVDNVLRDSHILDGKTVEAKRTVPREGTAAPSTGPKTKKIFVGGLKISTTKEQIKIYFEKFGKVVDCQVMQDHSTGRSRGFAFVTYEREGSVENALAQGKMHELDGKQVEIKKAEPKKGDEAPYIQNHGRGSYRRANVGPNYDRHASYYGALNGAIPPYYGGGSGGPYREINGNSRGYSLYGASYSNGGAYRGFYGYGGIDDRSGRMAYNYADYGPGSGYGNAYNSGGAYSVNGGGYGGYGGHGRGYNNGRYHPYSRS